MVRREMQLRAYSPVAFPNPQAVMYAEAVRHSKEFFYDFKRVRLIIVPRLNHIDEHVLSMEDSAIWVDWIRSRLPWPSSRTLASCRREAVPVVQAFPMC